MTRISTIATIIALESPGEVNDDANNTSATTTAAPHTSSTKTQLLRVLAGVFLLTCYTTFWLPYPQIRPHTNEDFSIHQTIPKIQLLRHVQAVPKQKQQQQQQHRREVNSILQAPPALQHARASPDAALIYEQPALERYYQQEGFIECPWTKYVNMGALCMVVLWVIYEHIGFSSTAAGGGGGGQQQQYHQPTTKRMVV